MDRHHPSMSRQRADRCYLVSGAQHQPQNLLLLVKTCPYRCLPSPSRPSAGATFHRPRRSSLNNGNYPSRIIGKHHVTFRSCYSRASQRRLPSSDRKYFEGAHPCSVTSPKPKSSISLVDIPTCANPLTDWLPLFNRIFS